MYNNYLIALVFQFALYLMLCKARTPAGMPEPSFVMLWFAFFTWGLQFNMVRLHVTDYG